MKLLDDVKVLHLEPTSTCNLRCPQCPRTEGDLPNEFLRHGDMTLEKAKETFSPEFIRNLEYMFMCGNFGEPASAKDCIAIYRYFREINPSIGLGMNTNGSLRSTKWWTELATVMGENSSVIWSIDGLEDTNHIYRRDAQWSRIMANANAFIAAGGNAQWDMLVFEHNKHQVDDVEALAKSMGFTIFRRKETLRPVPEAIQWLKKVNDKVFTPSDTVVCRALKEKSIYVNSLGELFPCCYIGMRPDVRKDFGVRGMTNVIDEVLEMLNTDPHPTCKRSCGVADVSNALSQWTKEVNLKNV
jgi:molybdenum cofactor biosynthesis enzyme MoaA